MNLRFAKMHGLGNDFMVLDLVSQTLDLTSDQVRCWADRHTGIGFDQLLIVEPPSDPEADFRYRIFNADGSEAEQCGNGARCVARFIIDNGLSRKQTIRFQTSTGPIEARLLEEDQVEVDMGVPLLDPAAVPCDTHQALSCSQLGEAVSCNLPGPDDASDYALIPLSVGNPHGVIEVPEIATAEVDRVGAHLTAHPFFPERANIGFCQIVDRQFVRLRVFERGVGETRACGTGACAAVVAGHIRGKLDERVKVSLPGGKVRIRWQGVNTPVKLTGPAALVYEGQIQVG
jgi:diaminopimelate epimerase